ncbi:uncharacterized protein K460DRAFT_317634 [Cucurbitaria berberidis CBS 394.84]
MEDTTMTPYSDSPTEPRSTSPVSSDLSSTIKPLPSLPIPSYTAEDEQPYHDEPPTPTETSPTQTHTVSRSSHPPRYQTRHISHRPYTDIPPSPSEAPPPSFDDDVPLAHLFLQPQAYRFETSYPQEAYPLEAPPSYSVAVRQAYRDTLVQYIPNGQHDPRDAILVEIDEESGIDIVRGDDVTHSVERVVAMFVVACLLLVMAAVLGWLALGSGVFA